MLKNVILFCSFIVLLLGPLQTIQAQNNVGIGTLTPSTDAILELFSNDKGFLAPRVTSVERATIPANSSGLLVFDTDENKFFYWNAALSIWQVMDDFSNTNELLQIAAFDDITKQITLTDAGATYTLDLNILSQRLSFSNDTLYISDKNGIDLGIYNKDSSATNELIQTTAFDQTTKQITLTDAGATFTLDLDTLSQRLSFSNDTLSISDRNKIDLGSYNKDSSASNELLQIAAFDQTTKQITLTDAGASFTLDLDTLSQLLSFSNDTLSISDRNKIDLGSYNKDSSATNELQSLSTSNDTIFMDRRGFIKLSEDEFWNTDGNAGTSPSNQFIGTTDNQDFVIRTDNTERLRTLGANGNIGIGTTAPDEKLDVQGNIELSGGNRSIHTQVSPLGRGGYSLTLRASNHNNNGNFAVNGGHVILQGGSGYNIDQGLGGGNVYLRSGHNDLTSNPGQRNGGYIIFETGGASGSKAERARMLDNGNFGIGTTNPGAKFQVGNKGDASFARANSWATFSDRRLKNKIELITNALDKLDQIHGYTYNWKNKSDSSRQVGVIAQEIELVMPEAVKTGSDGYKTVDYGKLSALLIQAVREQQTIITSLENKIEQQNTTIRDVKNAQKSLDERLLILEKK